MAIHWADSGSEEVDKEYICCQAVTVLAQDALYVPDAGSAEAQPLAMLRGSAAKMCMQLAPFRLAAR